MTSSDLTDLDGRILSAFSALMGQQSEPREDEKARQGKEFVCHTNKGSISRSAEREKCSWTMTRMMKLPCNLDFFSFQVSSQDSIIVTTGRACRRPVLSSRLETINCTPVLSSRLA